MSNQSFIDRAVEERRQGLVVGGVVLACQVICLGVFLGALGVEPMTSVTPMEMKKRADLVNDGEIADDIVRNAPDTVNHFFLVPKVVE